MNTQIAPRQDAPAFSSAYLAASAIKPCGNCQARASSVCNAVHDADLGRLAAVAVESSVDANRTFIEEGEPATHFFNVTSGTARLFKLLPDGRRQVTGFANKGHFLGVAATDRYSFSAEAIGSVRFCRFPRAGLCRLLVDVPALERALLMCVTTELIAAQEQMLLLGRKTARERVASFLVSQVELLTEVTPASNSAFSITLPMTRNDIADYLGLTIETVSRTMTRLRSNGLIDLQRPHDVEILKYERLVELAHGE